MSAPEPMAFQSLAIGKIADAIVGLTHLEPSKERLIVFRAPTGSGKTLMAAYSLSQAFSRPGSREFIVLWLSPGKGDLHKQSAKSLHRLLADSPLTVRLLDSQDDIVRFQDPKPGTVFVVNWEKLRTEKDGEWANKMLAQGENATLFQLLTNASTKGLDMVAVIDESHTNLSGPQTDKLMSAISELRPFVQLELSATPTKVPDLDLINEGFHHYVRVTFDDVEKAGLVRKSVLLNDRFAETQSLYPESAAQEQVLWAAWEKVAHLTAAYQAEGSPVKPLLLIQLPDGEKSWAPRAIVEDFLVQRGLGEGKTFAVWLSGDHSEDLDKIAQNDSPYRALIFKQAIATGWDCPRAQVLVQFRDPASETFQIQTLGRILRSPEQRHYENEELNVAYVFSNLEQLTVKVTSDEPDYLVKDLTLTRGGAYPSGGLQLSSVFQPRKREFHYPMIDNLEPALFERLNAVVPDILPEVPYTFTPVDIAINASVSTRDLDIGVAIGKPDQSVEGHLDDRYVQFIYDQILTTQIGQYRSREQSRSRIKTTISKWFKKNYPDWQADEIQHLVLRNQDTFILAINGACLNSMNFEASQALAIARAKRRTTNKWEAPLTELVASEKSMQAGTGFLYAPGLVDLSSSNPEKLFERWISAQCEAGKVVWWWKNGVGDERYLGLRYEWSTGPTKPKSDKDSSADEYITYPDYILQCDDLTAWVIEIKSIDDPEGGLGGKTQAKARGLAAWQKLMEESRLKSSSLVDLGKVCAGVVVPEELPTGQVLSRIGSPTAWTAPTKENLAKGEGWTPLVLGL